MSQIVCETWAENPIRSRSALVECWAIANLSGRDYAGAGFSDSDVQFLCSQPEGYAAGPLSCSLNTNKVAICELQSHFVCKRVIRKQEKLFLLRSSCKAGGK